MDITQNCWEVNLGEFKSDQKYFAKKPGILKSLKNNRNSSKGLQLMCS